MKAVLEFDLSDLDEELAYKQYLRAPHVATILGELRDAIRSKRKYGNLGGEALQELTELHELLFGRAHDLGIDVWEL